MTQYFNNLAAFIVGLFRLGEIEYKSGWGRWTFLPVYIIDYGTHVLSGGAVVSWSRWFYENRHIRWAKFFDRLLNHIDEDHGEEAGPTLWGTESCSKPVRILTSLFWLGVVLCWIF